MQMDKRLEEERLEALEGLREAVAALEAAETGGQTSPAATACEDARPPMPFVEGHGVQSLFFRFEWREEGLEVAIDLPVGRVLDGEEAMAEDNAAIGAACRLAILAITAHGEGRLLRKDEGEAEMSVAANRDGFFCTIRGRDGEVLDDADDWDALVSRLGNIISEAPGAEPMTVLWP